MNQEQAFFLRALTDHLFQRPTEVPDGLNWNELRAMAADHKLEGILYHQSRFYLKTHPELSPVRAAFEHAFKGTIMHTTSMDYELQCLSEAFGKAEIPFVPIKAAAISRFYPEPMLRTMGDMDLLVQADDAERIRPVMEELGYANKRWTEREWDYEKDQLSFELQSLLLHDTALEDAKQRAYLNDFWPHTFRDDKTGFLLLDWNFHFLYLIAHIGKHMKSAGVGFRQFFDLAVLTVRAPELFDWKALAAHAEKAGLLTFAKSCLTLCRIWFGVPSPLPEQALSEEDTESITQYVFANGVFGFQNEEPRSKELSRLRNQSKLPLPLLKLRVFLKFLFPSYRDLCTLTKYEGLRGRPWLLPWYWLKRIFRGMGSKRRASQAKTILTISDHALSEGESRLQKLGL